MKVTERPGSVRHVGTLNEEITRALSGMPTPDADEYWLGFLDRATLCDKLIFDLCALRADSPGYRHRLLTLRQWIAPEKLDSDIEYLRTQIAIAQKVTQEAMRNSQAPRPPLAAFQAVLPPWIAAQDQVRRKRDEQTRRMPSGGRQGLQQ